MSWIRLLALTCALLATSAAWAQDSAPLSFAEAGRKALSSHPQLQRFALAVQAAHERTAAAALRPPLEIEGEIENAFGSGALKGLDGSEITLSVGSIFERGGKRGARVDTAARAAELLSVEQRIEALDLLAETGRRFVALAAAQEAVTRARERAEQARRTLALIGPRVSAGRSPRTEQLNVEIELATAELAAADAQRKLEGAVEL